jgi:transposase InsO family protein
MNERLKFIAEYLEQAVPISELCRKYGISRRVGYKWIGRYVAEGPGGLEDRSRAPHHHPHAVATELEEMVVQMKGKYPLMGPKKILVKLREAYPKITWPATSTLGEVLKRYGLVIRRHKRRHASPSSAPLSHCTQANAVWSVDFKGHFYTGDRTRCDPLTISDAHTRYFLRCQAMTGHTGYSSVRPLFEVCFREFGLPDRIRSDNGPPFATVAVGGLSSLAIWWIKLGIVPERIKPAHPEQNGRHERLHRTLKEATASPPARTLREQQAAFDRFRAYYNEQRPHEALGQKTPASLYRVSEKTYPRRLASPEYPSDWTVRKIRSSGTFKWHRQELYLSEALIGETVGFEPRDDGLWCIHFMHVPLTLFDERRQRLRPLERKK